MGEALTETKVEPVSEPRIEFFEEENGSGIRWSARSNPNSTFPPTMA